jgi:hypothetical protein
MCFVLRAAMISKSTTIDWKEWKDAHSERQMYTISTYVFCTFSFRIFVTFPFNSLKKTSIDKAISLVENLN